MTVTGHGTDTARALRGLEDDRASVRLRAALAIGSTPDPRFVGKLVERCAVEPEFFVRDMLTWALTRHPVALALPRCSANSAPSGRGRGARRCTRCPRSGTGGPGRRSPGRW